MNILAVTAFVVRHHGIARGWGGRVVLPWLRWFADDGRIAHVTDKRGRLVAVGLARCVHDAQDARDPYRHDEGGPVVFVDLVVSCAKGAMAALWAALKVRFGVRARIVWQRPRGLEQLRSFNFNRTERLVYGW